MVEATGITTEPAQGHAPERLHGVEVLRFVLAGLVVLFHFLYFGPMTGDFDLPVQAVPALEFAGNYAVFAFFIVSGFVIAYSAERKDWIAFLASRVSRLYPALAVCAALTSAIVWLGTDFALPFGTFLAAATFVPVYAGEGMVDPSYWSIVYELRFYSLITVLLMIGRLNWATLVLTGLVAGNFLAAALGVSPAVLEWTLYPVGGFFALGLILYRARAGGWTTPLVLFAAINFVFGALGAYELTAENDLLDGVRAPLMLHVATSALCVAAVAAAIRVRVPQGFVPAAVLVGALSYPLYLLHQIAGYVVLEALGRVLPGIAALLLTIAAALVAAYVVHVAVEKPLSAPLRASLGRILRTGFAPARTPPGLSDPGRTEIRK